MKSVLISIQPKWCELIASGKKTVETRKNKPELKTPFKVYIYATLGKDKSKILAKEGNTIYITDYRAMVDNVNGKVIGEFVCDKIIWVLEHSDIFAEHPLFYSKAINDSCLTNDEVKKYSGGKDIYGWHISNLVIYDKPKELSEFVRPCNHVNDCWTCDRYDYIGNRCYDKITRPPQSWCYVEGK